MIAILLALAIQGMSDVDYEAGQERENQTVVQAQAIVNEAISREDYGVAVIRNTAGDKRSVCIIERSQKMTCARSTQLLSNHFHFAPASFNEVETGDLDIAAIMATERAWVGLPPLPSPTSPPTP